MNQQSERQTHVDYGELADYVDGQIAGTDFARVQEHLEHCDNCRSFVIWMQDIVDLMRTDDWRDAPVLLQQTVRARFADHQRRAQPRFAIGEWLDALFVSPRRVAFGVAALLLIILFGAFFLVNRGLAPQPSTAEIIAMRGTTEIMPAGDAEWQALEQSRQIAKGDTVRTDKEGLLLIAFPDDSLAQLEPETTLRVEELTQAGDNAGQSISLVQEMGQARYQVKPLASDGAYFRVRTASAEIAVVGTEFAVTVDRDGMTMVAVSEGTVNISAGAKTLVIGSGLGATVRPGGEPGEVVSVDVEEWRISLPDDSGQLVESTPTAVPAGQEDEAGAGTTAPEITPTGTPTRTPTRTPSATVSATNSPTPTPTIITATSTPTAPAPAPTQPPPGEDDGPTPTKKFPPGLTKTPEPPGQTKTPKPQGNNSGGNGRD